MVLISSFLSELFNIKSLSISSILKVVLLANLIVFIAFTGSLL